MKLGKKVFALCCISTIVLSFGACKPDATEHITTTTTGVQETAPTQLPTEPPATEPPQTEVTAAPVEATSPAKKTNAEIIELYNAAYNKTKAAGTLLGADNTTVTEVYLSGKKNEMLSKLMPSAMGMFNKPRSDNPLPPHEMTTSQVTEADVLSVDFRDDGSTYYIKLMPADATNISPGSAGAGKFFQPLPDIATVYLEPFGLKWTSGTKEENAWLEYSGGSCEVTVNKASGMIVSAKYVCLGSVNINNAQLGININGAKIPMETVTIYPAPQ